MKKRIWRPRPDARAFVGSRRLGVVRGRAFRLVFVGLLTALFWFFGVPGVSPGPRFQGIPRFSGIPEARADEIAAATALKVQGVRSDDVLKMRAGPSAKSRVVGSIPHDATGIKALRGTRRRGADNWSFVEYRGKQGWVARRFLALDEGEGGAALKGKRGLRCHGTEPHWRLDLDAGAVIDPGGGVTDPGGGVAGDAGRGGGLDEGPCVLDELGDKTTYRCGQRIESANRTNIWSIYLTGVASKGGAAAGVAFFERSGRCSDDASDRAFPIAVQVRFDDRMLSGCCEESK